MLSPPVQGHRANTVNQLSDTERPKETTTHVEETSSGKGKGVSGMISNLSF